MADYRTPEYREYKRNRYNSNQEVRAKQIKYSSDYQKKMWATSEEFRKTKEHQRKNPRVPTKIGRPLIDG